MRSTKIINIQGSIVDLGVLHGNSLFSMAHFSEIFEHRNYLRHIIGFDTFEGPTLNFHEKDAINDFELAQYKFFNKNNVSTQAELEVSIRNFNADRHMKQFEKNQIGQRGCFRNNSPVRERKPKSNCRVTYLWD